MLSPWPGLVAQHPTIEAMTSSVEEDVLLQPWEFAIRNDIQHLKKGVPNGSVTGLSIHHPLGFNWHPL